MIRIAIDGPGGAGKSSVAKAVASRLQIVYVDTGALYRTIGMYMLNSGVDLNNNEDVISNLDKFTLDLKFTDGKQVILLNGVDVGDEIRTPDVSMAASYVSAIPEVRQFLLDMQRNIAKSNSVIMDGRDIGTVILPDAEVKIFLTASPEARARRRYEELISKGKDVTYDDVYSAMVERDHNDTNRTIAPCVPASDAIILDNSDFDPNETVEAVVRIIKEKQSKIEEPEDADNKSSNELKNCTDGNDASDKPQKNFYMKAHRVLAPFFRWLLRLNPHGLENIPADGGIIFCSNHIGALDVISIAACTDRQVTFVAKKELFSIPILGTLITALGAIKIDRGGNDIGAIKASVNAAREGGAVAIFPEGHRYPGINPATTPKRNGAALIAYRSGCDIVPVCIQMKNAKYGLFRKIDVMFGEVIENSSLGFENGGHDEYEVATEKIFNEIVELSDYASLPSYDPEKDKHNKKANKKKR
jgi:cytidylate kinase